MQQQPAGWYRDPVRPNLHRFWSGEQWSDRAAEELATRSDEAVDPHDVQSRAAG